LQAIDSVLADNLNIADLLGNLFVWIRASNKELDGGSPNPVQAYAYEVAWQKLDAILGLGDATIAIPVEVQALADQRAEARKAKNFAKSDELRKALEALGWKVKDTAKGQELSPS
jgi:cysteinyl-tRNA synthetase